MLARLVIDDDVDAEQGHAQGLPQGPGQFPDDVVAGRLRHTLYVLPLKAHARTNVASVSSALSTDRPLPRLTCGITKNQMLQNPLAKVRNVLVKSHKNLSRTEVKSEDDSGLETLWLLKKMAFLSENRRKQKCKPAIQYSTHRYCIYSL